MSGTSSTPGNAFRRTCTHHSTIKARATWRLHNYKAAVQRTQQSLGATSIACTLCIRALAEQCSSHTSGQKSCQCVPAALPGRIRIVK